MHIGIDARMVAYRAGGISTYIQNLTWALADLATDETYTVFHSRKATEPISNAFQQVNLWTPCHHRIERTALAVELTPHQLDVFHSPDFIPPRWGARRHIITVHDLAFLHYPEFMTAESRRYYNDQISIAVQKADHILTISNATRDDLVQMLDVPAEKVSVHLLGVDNAFHPQPESTVQTMRERLDLPEDYVLFVGTFEPRKNIPGMLEAYKLLVDDLPDAPPLVLAGNKGWLLDDVRHKVTELNLTHHVLWREAIPQAELPALYTGAIAQLMPSFYEGFGLPALEAMACGTVPIVSDRASLPEVVGDVGLLINPDDPVSLAKALHRVLQDTPWRHQQEQAALTRAAAFTWEATATVAQRVYTME